MDSKENWDKRARFKTLLRQKLIPFMASNNYHLIFDNDLLDKDDKQSWVFKLVFEGDSNVEVSNDDWRDYTEYFNFYIDSENIFTINIDNYEDVIKAYNSCEQSLRRSLS